MWRTASGKYFAYSQNFAIIYLVSLMSELQVCKCEHLQFNHQWATALCNTAITIANIEGGKIVCAQ